jgi:2-polyprenyl-6-hydroxyphenyl methylase/3-demethylubiquinone-9 3-methyltransferase
MADHADFYNYYEKESESAGTRARFMAIKATVLRLIEARTMAGAAAHAIAAPAANAANAATAAALDVADIGCGAGTQCQLWAADGHRVHGADINAGLIALARRRSAEAGFDIRFEVASATALPWPDQSMDVCIAPELLEHVADWQGVLNELVRVLKPGGALYLSTSNKLCPKQEEYTLPLYAWYPGFVKRHVERLAMSTQPQLAGHATYPAVNWFSFYGLRDVLAARGFTCLDRFDMIDQTRLGLTARRLVGLVRRWPPLRFLGHVATSYTVLLGFRTAAGSGFAPYAVKKPAGPGPTG